MKLLLFTGCNAAHQRPHVADLQLKLGAESETRQDKLAANMFDSSNSRASLESQTKPIDSISGQNGDHAKHLCPRCGFAGWK